MAKRYSYQTGAIASPKKIRRRRLFLLLPAGLIIILLFLSIVGNIARGRQQEVTDYFDAVNEIAEQSNRISKRFTELTKTTTASSQGQFKSSLTDLIAQSQDIFSTSMGLKNLEELKEANSFLVISMRLRNEGLEKYQSAVLSAMSGVASVDAKEISLALKDLSLSDSAYTHFIKEAQAFLNEEEIKIKIQSSKFISDETVYEQPKVSAFLQQIKSKAPVKGKAKVEDSKIKADTDVYISDVATEPLRASVDANGVRELPSSDEVAVRIAVGLKGSAQKKVPVEVVLYVKGDSKSEEKSSVDLTANGIAKVTIPGFSPTEKEVNTFKIKVGPLKGEAKTDNNEYEYKFRMQ